MGAKEGLESGSRMLMGTVPSGCTWDSFGGP